MERQTKPQTHQAPLNKSLPATPEALAPIEEWFRTRGWTPFGFQREAWIARLRGESGLIHVPTGAGKTYAAFLGALAHAISQPASPGLKILYVTPLKAVSRDIRLALEEAIRGLGSDFRVEDRTGDTSAYRRVKQKLAMPDVLVTTPESLELLLCDPEHEKMFAKIHTIILDEWHECLSNKRGSLLELTLSRLRAIRNDLVTWALSATISNVSEAATVATGHSSPRVIKAAIRRPIEIRSLIPTEADTLPWSTRLGETMKERLIRELDPSRSTLIFANTRNQAEKWFQYLIEARAEWVPILALHHGSLDSAERHRIEEGVKRGSITLVVCTSTLDLGVDFGPVERVVQIGSPKGLARLAQRAGRSAHRPGETSSVIFVPLQPLELLEISSIRSALAAGIIEARRPVNKPLDVLVQHLVTRAVGGGFTREQILNEIRSAYSFRTLSEEELDWALTFLIDGGYSLQAYPAYRKIEFDGSVYRVKDPSIARLHKMSVGTIASDSTIALKFQRGKRIGQIDEGFISKLKKGDRFLFGGRVLEFIGLQNLEAIVKVSSKGANVVTSWQGSRFPYSEPLAHALRRTIDELAETGPVDEETRALRHIIVDQERVSSLPHESDLLVETTQTREGRHLFVYPFEGRLMHEGIAALLAFRLARIQRATFSLSCNDYGIEILCAEDFPFEAIDFALLLHPERCEDDLRKALDLTQLARQRFREIARVAGLVHPGRPGTRKSARQIQMSAGLLFDVFKRYEPGHPLVLQAENQVIAELLERGRFGRTLERLSGAALVFKTTARPSPFAFPLIAERLTATLSTESLADRIDRMKKQWTTA